MKGSIPRPEGENHSHRRENHLPTIRRGETSGRRAGDEGAQFALHFSRRTSNYADYLDYVERHTLSWLNAITSSA